MKPIFILLTAILLFSSCQRCLKCSYEYEVADADTTAIYEYGEFCGPKRERDAYEQKVRSEASVYNGTVECIEN